MEAIKYNMRSFLEQLNNVYKDMKGPVSPSARRRSDAAAPPPGVAVRFGDSQGVLQSCTMYQTFFYRLPLCPKYKVRLY